MNLHELDGDYEILGELGRGGTAVVYRAKERELGRDVAIKVVRGSHLDDQEAVARLSREAKLVAQLRHPNIVPLLGIRHLSDGLALIMQHVPGQTLKASIRQHGPMPIDIVEHVLREIGAALDYAHKKHGIVHRDIKPENIYLDEEINRALLSDFGIARATEGESNLTLVGTALGTPAYMSPEQIDGSTLDGRSDLFSLGLVAYEMLTGQQPWAGSNLYTIIYKQKHEDLPALSTVRRDVPTYIERVVETLLRKNPAERYADALQMMADLPSGGAAITLPMAAPATPPVQVVPSDDAPTLRFQRPTFTIVEHHEPEVVESAPEAEPAPEEVIPAPAAAAIAALLANEIATPEPAPEPEVELEHEEELEPAAVAVAVAETETASILEGASGRWRLPALRGRGGLAAGGAFAPAEPVEAAAAVAPAPTQFIDVVGLKREKFKMVAAITLFLVLSGSATVVAMRNSRPRDGAEQLAAKSENSGAAQQTLMKASGVAVQPVANAANEGAAPKTAEREAAKPETKTEAAAELPLPLPKVSLPDISPTSTGRQVSEADFTPTTTAPTRTIENIAAAPTFTPHTIKPELRNRDVVQRALTEYYPRVLRERNIGGTVNLWVLIDSAGKVIKSQVNETSGNVFLDEAAAKVADAMRFTPAMNRDQKVSVWIKLPVIFRTR